MNFFRGHLASADFHDLLWHTSPTAGIGITSLNRLAAAALKSQ